MFLNFSFFHRRSRDSESLENIVMRSSDGAPSTPEDNINVVVRLVDCKYSIDLIIAIVHD